MNAKTVSSEKKEYNYGLALLKVFMCFEVIIKHYMDWNGARPETLSRPLTYLLRYQAIAVPVFMFSSFMLVDYVKLASDKALIKKRFYRLLLPHFFWAIIYFVVYNIVDPENRALESHKLKDLLWQLFLGHSFNQSEWFQINLILLTLLFVLVFRYLSQKNALRLSVLMCITALILQYSGINGSILTYMNIPGSIDPGYYMWTISRIMEMLPYACLGILIHRQLFDSIKDRWFAIVASLMSLWFIFHHMVFHGVEKSYEYAGLYSIAVTLLTILLFYLLPLSGIPSVIRSVIQFLSRYCMAVFYIHRLIRELLFNTKLSLCIPLKEGSLFSCFVIYFFSLLCAWLMSLIPIRIVKDSIV